jgi:hypothetical protein
MARGAVILRQDANVALIERVRGGKTYHLFPGGQTEGGTFGTGTGTEYASPVDSPDGSYRAIWLPFAALSTHDVRPRALAEALLVGHLADRAEPLRIIE